MQQRLRDEIRMKSHSSPLVYEDLEGLKYLNNVMKEVLRYYPPGLATLQASADNAPAN